jgi:hypothetical protein
MEPVYQLKAKYTALKTKGTYRSGSNDQGKSSRKKTGAKLGSGNGVMVLDALTGKRRWAQR